MTPTDRLQAIYQKKECQCFQEITAGGIKAPKGLGGDDMENQFQVSEK